MGSAKRRYGHLRHDLARCRLPTPLRRPSRFTLTDHVRVHLDTSQMSSFLSRVKAQFASSTSTPSSSSKKSSNIHLSAPSSSSTPSGRTPSSTSSAKSPPARQGTISRKISQLSASSSSAPPNGSNGKDYPPRGKTPLPTLELSLDEPLSPGGIGLTRRGSVLDLAVNEGDEETGADDEKKREILGKSRWTSEQVREFVELVGQKMKERGQSHPPSLSAPASLGLTQPLVWLSTL